MRTLKISLLISLALTLSACIVVPKIDQEEANQSACKTYTRSMKLDVVVMNPGGCSDEYCLAAYVAVFAGSAIISGSIVLTGNTVHWLEYQGTCSDSYLNTTKQRFLDSINKSKPAPETRLNRNSPSLSHIG
jgi:hypothetical protein